MAIFGHGKSSGDKVIYYFLELNKTLSGWAMNKYYESTEGQLFVNPILAHNGDLK